MACQEINDMGDKAPEHSSEADSELEREIRTGRTFTLSDAIGRAAGAGVMKGASPVSRQQQAGAEIEAYLSRHLADTAGILFRVLTRHVKVSELLLHGDDQPFVVLADYVRGVLDSEYGLRELVREVDVEWGRVFGERPHFEKDGCPVEPADPYTVESVRASLIQLADGLAAREA